MSKKPTRIELIQRVLVGLMLILCSAIIALTFWEALLSLPGDKMPSTSFFALIALSGTAVLVGTGQIFLRFIAGRIQSEEEAKKKAGRARRPFTRY